MNRPTSRWIATTLAACLTLALAGCGGLGKKNAAEGAEGAAQTAEADSKKKDSPEPQGDAAAAGAKPDAKKEEKKEEAKKETPPKDAESAAAPDPASAEEFKGLPKGEPEFVLACRSLAAGGKGTMTGKDGFVFETSELAALAANSKTGTPRHAAMVAAIKAKADALRASGVELVIAPVPPKPVVYPDFLGAEPALKDRRYDSYLQALYAELEKSGVRVADVTKALRSDRFDKSAASFPKTGVVWSPAAVASSARAVHTAARKTEAAKAISRDKTIVSRDSALTQNGETFKARSVGWAQGDRLVPATVAKEGAPIVVIGDEHAGVHRSGGVNASLADQLSLAFGAPVDTQAIAGLGWKEAADFTPAKDSPTNLVVWCFSAADFLEAPVAPKKPARPRRPATRPSDSGGDMPAPSPGPGAGLRLRDDPGLEGRSE
jgi:alginate O-acetyltransferase complex protein AlgJ